MRCAMKSTQYEKFTEDLVNFLLIKMPQVKANSDNNSETICNTIFIFRKCQEISNRWSLNI